VPRCSPTFAVATCRAAVLLCLDEKAEAVRLARAGVSMRAISRQMGVDRKGVRLALVEAGLIATP
jgi:transposase-like protein